MKNVITKDPFVPLSVQPIVAGAPLVVNPSLTVGTFLSCPWNESKL